MVYATGCRRRTRAWQTGARRCDRDAAVSGNQRRAVFDAGRTLEHRFEEVAGDARARRARARWPPSSAGRRPAPVGGPRNTKRSAPRQTRRPRLRRLLGAEPRRQRMAAEQPARVKLRRVADDNGGHQQHHCAAARRKCEHRPARRAEARDRSSTTHRRATPDGGPLAIRPCRDHRDATANSVMQADSAPTRFEPRDARRKRHDAGTARVGGSVAVSAASRAELRINSVYSRERQHQTPGRRTAARWRC